METEKKLFDLKHDQGFMSPGWNDGYYGGQFSSYEEYFWVERLLEFV